MSAILRAQGLTMKSFPGDSGFDLSIEPGQRWLISGDSGSGKSTLMRTMLGLISPRSGDVFLDGFNLQDVTPKQLLTLRQSIGVVFAGGGLLPAWTGLQNLMLPLRTIKGLDEESAHEEVLAFASRCNIPALWLERAATQMTAEQGTLLALARALIIKPKLLWIDSELVWGVLSHANSRLGGELVKQVEQGCALVAASGVHGVLREQVPLCGAPTHHGRMQDGWLECMASPTYWTLEPADA